MLLTEYPALKKLSRAKKMKLADELWRASISDSMPVTAQQKRMLDARWADYKAGKIECMSLAEFKKRMAKK